MSYPQDYPRLTFKFEKDENGKLVLDSEGHPVMTYLLYNEDRTSYRELTKEEATRLVVALEENEGEH